MTKLLSRAWKLLLNVLSYCPEFEFWGREGCGEGLQFTLVRNEVGWGRGVRACGEERRRTAFLGRRRYRKLTNWVLMRVLKARKVFRFLKSRPPTPLNDPTTARRKALQIFLKVQLFETAVYFAHCVNEGPWGEETSTVNAELLFFTWLNFWI